MRVGSLLSRFGTHMGTFSVLLRMNDFVALLHECSYGVKSFSEVFTHAVEDVIDVYLDLQARGDVGA